MKGKDGDVNGRLKREFEGEDALTQLLVESGCTYTYHEIIQEFECGIEEGSQAGEIVSLLWEREPRFKNVATAQRTFGNLFGLWDLIAAQFAEGLIDLDDPKSFSRPLTINQIERLTNELSQLPEGEFARAQSRFENECDGMALFSLQRLSESSELIQGVFFRLAFDTWWILGRVSTTALPTLTQAQFNLVEEQLNEGLVDGEPALAHLVDVAIWDHEADDQHIAPSEARLIEHCLTVVRNAYLQVKN